MGAAAGAAAGFVRVRRQARRRSKRRPVPPRQPGAAHDWLQILGSTFGGIVGAAGPDTFEPAVDPNHRGPAHSVAAAALVGRSFYSSFLSEFEDACRDTAEALARKREAAVAKFHASTGMDALIAFFKAAALLLAEIVMAMLAGFPAGVPAGYISHLAADATTPKCVPIVGLRAW
jgi:hypothetical protein